MRVFLNGSQFKIILIQRNLTQESAATKIGITRPHFNRLLHGISNPNPDTRNAIIKAFRGVAWDKLFTIVDTEERI